MSINRFECVAVVYSNVGHDVLNSSGGCGGVAPIEVLLVPTMVRVVILMGERNVLTSNGGCRCEAPNRCYHVYVLIPPY